MQQQLSKMSLYEIWVKTSLFVRGEFKCTWVFEICLLTISSLQTLLMVIHPSFEELNKQQVNTSVETIYTFLIRTEIYLINNQHFKKQFVYLIVFTIFFVSKFGFIILMYVIKKLEHSEKFYQSTKHSMLLTQFLQIQSIYQQLLCPLFIIPFNTLLCISIKENFNQLENAQPVFFINLILAVLTFILLQIDQILICTINRVPITFRLKPMERSKITKSHFFCYVLNSVSIIIFTMMSKSQVNQIILCLLILISSLLAIRNQFINKIYFYRTQEIIFYFGNALQLLFSILQLLDSFFFIKQKLFILLTITPLLMLFIFSFVNFENRQTFLLFFKNTDNPNVNILMNTLIKILNKCDIPEKHVVFRSSLINYFHSKQCQLKECLCQTTFFIAEPRQANAITGQIFKAFIFEKIQSIKQSIYKKNSEHYCDQELLITYSIFLNDFGWTMLAARSFNKLLLNDNAIPSNSNFTTQAFDKSTLMRQTKELTIRSTTLKYKKFKSSDSENEKKQANEMKIMFKINLGMINRARIDQLFNQTKWNMKATFGSSLQAAQQSFISQSINQYLQYEFAIQQIKRDIIQLINKKIQFFQEIMKEKQIDVKKILGLTKNLCGNLINTEIFIKQQFEKFPSIRLQRALTFFLTELYCNIIEANKVFNSSVNVDLKFIQNNHSALNLSQSQSSYAILTLNEDLKHLEVQSVSNSLLKLIGKQGQQTTFFSEILPLFFYQYHPVMVNKFLTTGKSKYYRNFSSNFVNVNDCLVKGIQLCYDVTSLYHHQQLVFVAFIQELPYEKCYIIVDGFDKSFISLSYNFLQKLGYDDQMINKMVKYKYLNEISIYNIFPKFDQALQKQQQENRLLIEEVQFFEYQKVKKSTLVEKNEKRFSNLNMSIWKQKDKVQKYIAKLNIYERVYDEFSYYIIEIQDLSKPTEGLTIDDQISQTISSCTSKQSSSLVSCFSNLEDDCPNKINVFEVNQQLSLFSPLTTLPNNAGEFSSRQVQINTKLTTQNQFVEKLIQNDTMQQLQKMNHSQQAFYNSKLQHLISYKQNSSISVDNKSEDKEKQFSQQQQQNYAQSQSSVASINLSVNYKKFELVQKLTSKSNPLKVNQFIFSLLLQSLIQIIYFILVLILMPIDLDTSIEEINMIGLHADIMAPHDLYFSMRVTISSYQQALRENFINQALFTKLTDPYYDNIYLGYEELKVSLYAQLINPYLQPFYNDYSLDVKFMKENDTQIVSEVLKFRQVLLTILQYQYAYAKLYSSRKSPGGSTFQVFLYANYFNIHDLLEQITVDILVYSHLRSDTVHEKWMIFWVISIIMIFFASVASLFTYNQYLIQYDKFLQLMNYFTLNNLEQEIQKQRIILSNINHEEKIIFEYELNLDKLQGQLDNTNSTHHTQFRDKKLQKKLKVPRTKAILAIFFFCSIFIGYSTIVDQSCQSYFEKYQQTIGFYKLIQDLKLNAGSILVQKEIFYRWINFTYLTNNDKERLQALVHHGLETITSYINYANSYNFDLLIVSSTFVDYFSLIQTANLCSLLSENFTSFMGEQCNHAFEGTLKKGTIQSLNYIVYSIQAEQSLNNFTSRTVYNLYEQEGSQVITRTFIQLSDELSKAIQDFTETQKNFSQSLSIVFFIVSILIGFLIIKWLRNYLITEFNIVKKIVSVAPLQLILKDESYERQLRLLLQLQETN